MDGLETGFEPGNAEEEDAEGSGDESGTDEEVIKVAKFVHEGKYNAITL